MKHRHVTLRSDKCDVLRMPMVLTVVGNGTTESYLLSLHSATAVSFPQDFDSSLFVFYQLHTRERL